MIDSKVFKVEPYIETVSGKAFYFLEPTVEMIDIEDIAFALSHQCRFNGHCSRFYSVAEHSVYVASLLPPELRLAGLLHDAAEAYITDMPTPIKQFLPDYIAMEKRIAEVISKAFELDGDGCDSPEVKRADRQQLRTEAYHLLPSRGETWDMWKDSDFHVEGGVVPLCAPPNEAYRVFMAAYKSLTTKPEIVLAHA